MEKRVSQASHKICKNDKTHENSLIKALRPKVYITDSSKFKKLVQELTGNGKKPISPSNPSKKEQCSVAGIQNENLRKPDNSFEFSDYSPELSLGIEDYIEAESSLEISTDSQKFNDQTFSPMSPLPSFMDLQSSLGYRNTDAVSFEEFQSYDPSPFFDGYCFQSEHELCISDYDLSDIIDRF